MPQNCGRIRRALFVPQPTLRGGRTPRLDPARGPTSRLIEGLEKPIDWDAAKRDLRTGLSGTRIDTLDKSSTLQDGVYIPQIAPGWFLLFQRDE